VPGPAELPLPSAAAPEGPPRPFGRVRDGLAWGQQAPRRRAGRASGPHPLRRTVTAPSPAPRPAPQPRARRPLRALALAAALLAAGAPALPAAPVRTALAAESGDGSWRFLTDLAELWRSRYDPTPEQLAVRTVRGAQARLRAVSRGRGDFAVVDAATVAERLADYPRLTALAVLWPDLMLAVSRNPAVRELKLPVGAELWVLDSAGFAYDTLSELAGSDAGQRARLLRMPENLLLDALDYGQEPVLLFTAPTPLLELNDALKRDARLQVLPIDNKIVDELKLAHPWLMTEKLERGAYPGLQRNLELPAVYRVLVGRRDLPAATVRKVLDTVYGRTSAMAPFDPLFGQTDGRMNAVFGKLMSFHAETARRFNFTPSVP
jgi:TRAP-type uncharacterized transport system substrate-binding protein